MMEWNTDYFVPYVEEGKERGFWRKIEYPFCVACGELSQNYIQLPYGSDFDGMYLCSDCIRTFVDPAIRVRRGDDLQDGSNRDVPFFKNIMCQGCERMGAYDFMGDYLCLNCADVEWVSDGADDGDV